jgi:hypothetical protein
MQTFFFDNPAWVTGEKADTWLKRALAKRLDKKRYDAALTALRTCPERSRETHLDTIRKTAYAVSQQPSYDFSGAGWPQLSNSIAIEEGPIDLPEEATSVDVRAAYIAHNQPLLARDGPKIRFILCQDEADVSIYRYTAETPPTSISVVVSPDSDFDFIPRAAAIPYKLHMERSPKADKRRPWVTTNNVGLQAFAPMWVWEDHAAAVTATLLNGQDYSGTGVLGLGFAKLRLSGIVKEVSDGHVRTGALQKLTAASIRRHCKRRRPLCAPMRNCIPSPPGRTPS